jgi:hypothetical protein
MKKIISIIVCLIFFSTILTVTASELSIINMDNHPPNPPEIEGPTSGTAGDAYVYYFTVTDPDEEDRITTLWIDWDEGEEPEEICAACGPGPWYNGEVVEVEHIWRKTGTYDIKAKSEDTNYAESEWSEPYPVTMPRNRVIQNQWFQNFFEKWDFPLLTRILKL